MSPLTFIGFGFVLIAGILATVFFVLHDTRRDVAIQEHKLAELTRSLYAANQIHVNAIQDRNQFRDAVNMAIQVESAAISKSLNEAVESADKRLTDQMEVFRRDHNALQDEVRGKKRPTAPRSGSWRDQASAATAGEMAKTNRTSESEVS